MHGRLFHVLRQPSGSTATSLNVVKLVSSVPELSKVASLNTTFEVIGSGSALLRIGLPANTTVHTKPNTLLAAFNSSGSGTLPIAVSTILAGLQSWLPSAIFATRFQKLEALDQGPVSLLIAAQEPAKSLAVVSLDGSVDWIVTDQTALHTYSGDSLRIEQGRRPSSRLYNYRHTFISGRGLIALSSHDQLLKVALDDESQSFLVSRDCLVAFSADANSRNSPVPISQALVEPTDASTSTSSWRRYLSILATPLRAKQPEYLRIHGPKTLIVKSSTASKVLHSPLQLILSKPNLNENPLETAVHTAAIKSESARIQASKEAYASGMQGPPRHHLKYATVTQAPGGSTVSFESTDSFR